MFSFLGSNCAVIGSEAISILGERDCHATMGLPMTHCSHPQGSKATASRYDCLHKERSFALRRMSMSIASATSSNPCLFLNKTYMFIYLYISSCKSPKYFFKISLNLLIISSSIFLT